MLVRSIDSEWIIHAPAKINLALEVQGRRHDGYHQVETLLTRVRLFDTLKFQPKLAGEEGNPRWSLQIVAANRHQVDATAQIPSNHRNLVAAALLRLAEESGHPVSGRWTLYKRIPTQAGLGGGSSDAAAALVLANQAWGLGYSRPRLARIAATLGTDVPFFLSPSAAIGRGRGEQLQAAPLPSGMPLVLLHPPVGLATPNVFSKLGLAFGECLDNGEGISERLAQALAEGAPPQQWQSRVYNALQPAASQLTEWIERLQHTMAQLPVLAHQMTGSGSGYFALCRTWRLAQQVAARLRGWTGLWSIATRTYP